MLRYTVKDVFDLHPCCEYTRQRIKSLLPEGYTDLSLTEILELPVKAQDKVWVACALLPVNLLREFICDIVEELLLSVEREFYRQLPVHRKAVESLRTYLDGLLTTKTLCKATEMSGFESESLESAVLAHALSEAGSAVAYACKYDVTFAARSITDIACRLKSLMSVLTLSVHEQTFAAAQVELLRLYAVIAEGE